jgi:hypothetical protein
MFSNLSGHEAGTTLWANSLTEVSIIGKALSKSFILMGSPFATHSINPVNNVSGRSDQGFHSYHFCPELPAYFIAQKSCGTCYQNC